MEVSVGRCKVFLADQGKGVDPARPTILFIHGAGMDHSVWPLQARHFAYRGWNSLAVDLAGHGRSRAVPGKSGLLTDVTSMADWIDRLLAALGTPRAHLVGHSMGTLIALETAARHHARVASVALLGAATAMPVHPALLEAAGRPEPLAAEMICDWGFGPSGHFGGHRAPGSWMLGHAMTLVARAAGPVLRTDLAACAAYQGGAAAAAAVSCPALIVAGRLDRMTPAREGLKLAGLIDGARPVVLEDAGHMMMVERPDATLDALVDFLGPASGR